MFDGFQARPFLGLLFGSQLLGLPALFLLRCKARGLFGLPLETLCLFPGTRLYFALGLRL